MLSYQHIYHAGNLADVHKHALLCWMLDYLTRKNKPVSYVETHAGRGLYMLSAPEAIKTGEAAAGIARLADRFDAAHPYAQRMAQVRAAYGTDAYAGSPLLAAMSLRPGDALHLAELHPQEFAALQQAMGGYRATCYRHDGCAMALSICPPTPRRGLMLIDPSYEIKTDYTTLPVFVGQVARKWNVGIIALWYPILTSGAHVSMLSALVAAHPDALRHEITFPPARAGHGMIGSGMFVINPPWGLADEAKRLARLVG